MDVTAFTAAVLGDGDDSSDANDLIAAAAAHGTAAGGKDTHGRKPGNEHYGHDHEVGQFAATRARGVTSAA